MENTDTIKILEEMILTKNIRVEDNRLLLLGRPGMIISADLIVSLIKPLLDIDPQIVKNAGRIAIRQIAEDYSKRFNDIKATLDFMQKISPLYGIGKINIVMNKEEVILTINPSVFAETYVRLFGLSNKPICYFSAGIFEEFLSKLLGKDYSVEEVSCVAKGDSECKFIATVKQ